ncbi:hypothetical protein [Gordonia hongkongensis]|uniref:hypothetical protein n=1 Tax=Gordonia hongkongensis TaxID=1701090 RepID=UPI000856B3D5|nr:hypothetical protein [Gordonia hongkongensis]OCW84075.1 hypothetical protein A8M60_12240 [Nocardia farcinica]UPG67548.1 hypothetical protein MVF96_19305 [Gordonia hongkongensis]
MEVTDEVASVGGESFNPTQLSYAAQTLVSLLLPVAIFLAALNSDTSRVLPVLVTISLATACVVAIVKRPAARSWVITITTATVTMSVAVIPYGGWL